MENIEKGVEITCLKLRLERVREYSSKYFNDPKMNTVTEIATLSTKE